MKKAIYAEIYLFILRNFKFICCAISIMSIGKNIRINLCEIFFNSIISHILTYIGIYY